MLAHSSLTCADSAPAAQQRDQRATNTDRKKPRHAPAMPPLCEGDDERESNNDATARATPRTRRRRAPQTSRAPLGRASPTSPTRRAPATTCAPARCAAAAHLTRPDMSDDQTMTTKTMTRNWQVRWPPSDCRIRCGRSVSVALRNVDERRRQPRQTSTHRRRSTAPCWCAWARPFAASTAPP